MRIGKGGVVLLKTDPFRLARIHAKSIDEKNNLIDRMKNSESLPTIAVSIDKRRPICRCDTHRYHRVRKREV